MIMVNIMLSREVSDTNERNAIGNLFSEDVDEVQSTVTVQDTGKKRKHSGNIDNVSVRSSDTSRYQGNIIVDIFQSFIFRYNFQIMNIDYL